MNTISLLDITELLLNQYETKANNYEYFQIDESETGKLLLHLPHKDGIPITDSLFGQLKALLHNNAQSENIADDTVMFVMYDDTVAAMATYYRKETIDSLLLTL